MTGAPLKILGLSGSYGMSSSNGKLLKLALDYAQNQGIEIHYWDHEKHPLPLVGEEGCWEHPHVKQLQNLATEMDGYILTSPEYHGTMSGVMKNTLDWLYNKHVGGKAFALMSTLGGMTNSNTLNHMRISVRWLGGWCVPQQIAVGKVKNAFSDDGSLVDDELTERMESMVDALAGMCRHLKGA